MKLRAYLERKSLSQSDFAVLLDVRREAVARWLSGERHPRLNMARRIEEITKGWVKVADLYS
jgi:transcriptional regulator with XRE-family HTH domain